MSHRATLHYTNELVRSAALSFLWRGIGWTGSVGLALCLVSLALSLTAGDRSWKVGAVGMAAFFALLLVVMVCIIHLRQSLSKLRALRDPVSTFIAEEQSFTITSDVGSSTLKWSAVYDIWQFQRYWLLLFSRSQFITLPIIDIPEEMQAYILERIRVSKSGHGG